MATVEKTAYAGWPNCYRLANESIEAIATSDVGPRIIHFGFLGKENEFQLMAGQAGLVGGEAFRLYGGHRLWHAPEDPQRTYYPDNEPIFCQIEGDSILLRQPVERTTGIQKEIEIQLFADHPGMQVTHRLINRNLWEVELAPWALSVMAAGGTAILPLPERIPWPARLLAGSSLALWSYTDLSDPRWTWGEKFILLRQDQAALRPQKIGLLNEAGWLAYARNGHLFVKCFTYQPAARYPDLNSSAEVYTDQVFLELETLGPIRGLAPGGAVEHREHWFLFAGVASPLNDQQVSEQALPRVSQALAWKTELEAIE